MKKKIFIGLFTFLAIAPKAFAFNINETFNKNASQSQYIENYIERTINGSTQYYTGEIHKQTGVRNSTGATYDLFCIDGWKRANSNLIVKAELDNNNPVDAAFLYIMSASNYSYETRLTAVRAFLPLTEHANFNVTLNADFTPIYAQINSGLYWVAEASNDDIHALFRDRCVENNCDTTPGSTGDIIADELYDHILARNGVAQLNSNSSHNTTRGEKFQFSGDFYRLNSDIEVNRNARTLIHEAVHYAAQVKNGNKSGKETTILNQKVTNEVSEVLDAYRDPSKLQQKEIDFSVSFKGFASSEEKSYVKLSLNPDTTGKITLDKSLYRKLNSGEEWKEFTSATDFASIIDSDDVIIEVKALVSTNATSSEAYSVTFSVDPQYMVKGDLSGAILYPNETDYTSVYQRFMVADGDVSQPAPDDVVHTFSYTWEPDCLSQEIDKNDTQKFKTFLKTCCRPSSSKAYSVIDDCKKSGAGSRACKVKEEYCDYCNGTVSVPKACTEFSDGHLMQCANPTDAIVKDPEDIQICVLDYYDENLNTYEYKREQAAKDNPYCQVFCKEDYVIGLPTGKWENAGRSFGLSIDVSGTKTCYTNKINYEQFVADLNNPAVDNEKAYQQYKFCANAGWTNDIDFDSHKITLDYDENYIKSANSKYKENGRLKLVPATDSKGNKLIKTTESEPWLCDGVDTDRKYNECIGGNASVSNTANLPATVSEFQSGSYHNTRFAKKTITKQTTYVVPVLFATKNLEGIVKDIESVGQSNLSKYDLLSSEITTITNNVIDSGDLPIQLNKTRGAYVFDVKFDGIGEYYDKVGKTGRLVGSEQAFVLANEDTKFEGNYYCSYVVNCPNCPTDCIEDPAQGIFCTPNYIPDKTTTTDTPCTGDYCPSACEPFCAFDQTTTTNKDNKKGYNFSTRQISVSDPNPNKRAMGYNFETEKGKETLLEIVNTGDVDYGKTSAYVFNLTPSMISEIKEYNRDNLKSGGYLNDSLTCVDYSSTLTEAEKKKEAKKHDYLICTSTFLDDLKKKYGTGKNPGIVFNRETTSWLNSGYCEKQGTCNLEISVGPAWK